MSYNKKYIFDIRGLRDGISAHLTLLVGQVKRDLSGRKGELFGLLSMWDTFGYKYQKIQITVDS